MTKKHRQASPAGLTDFTCHAPNAETVFLAGSFNNWDPNTTPMHPRGDAIWSTGLELAPGRYEYKFIIDGVWSCGADCNETLPCPHCVPNAFGTMNRVIEVPAREAA